MRIFVPLIETALDPLEKIEHDDHRRLVMKRISLQSLSLGLGFPSGRSEIERLDVALAIWLSLAPLENGGWQAIDSADTLAIFAEKWWESGSALLAARHGWPIRPERNVTLNHLLQASRRYFSIRPLEPSFQRPKDPQAGRARFKDLRQRQLLMGIIDH